MNKNEYYTNNICGKNREYIVAHELLKRWKINNGIANHTKCVIHHIDDTEECRNYNEAHYELWGFNLDGTFEYGKYVVFMTQSEHNTHHFKGKINSKVAGENNGMFGKHRYGEQAPMFGKKHSTETHTKMCINHANVTGENNPFYGKTHSDITINKMLYYHKTTSDAYHRYKDGGGILNWKEFRHAIKIGEIDISIYL
jgi:hypothetical protein